MQSINLADAPGKLGLDLGRSRSISVDARTIRQFGRLLDGTSDGLEDGKAPLVVPPMLLLALIPELLSELVRFENRGHGLNYGLDNVLFHADLPSGEQFWLSGRLAEAKPRGGGMLVGHDLIISSTQGPICTLRALVLISPPPIPEVL